MYWSDICARRDELPETNQEQFITEVLQVADTRLALPSSLDERWLRLLERDMTRVLSSGSLESKLHKALSPQYRCPMLWIGFLVTTLRGRQNGKQFDVDLTAQELLNYMQQLHLEVKLELCNKEYADTGLGVQSATVQTIFSNDREIAVSFS